MAVLLKIISSPQRQERIVAAGFFIFIEVLIGIHDIDEFSQEKSHSAQCRLPCILIDCKELRHDIAKIPADLIDVRVSR